MCELNPQSSVWGNTASYKLFGTFILYSNKTILIVNSNIRVRVTMHGEPVTYLN